MKRGAPRSTASHETTSSGRRRRWVAESRKGELAEGLSDALQRAFDILARVKGADSNMPLAALAEACPRSADDLGLIQQKVEEFPGITTSVDPDVGSVVAAHAPESEFPHGGPNECGVGEIETGHL